MKKSFVVLAVAGLSMGPVAAQVPPLGDPSMSAPPPMASMGGSQRTYRYVEKSPSVNRPASEALKQSQRWANDPSAVPAVGNEGRVVFTYGESVPTIICAPLRLCTIELEAGETVLDRPHLGDSVRWRVSPLISGVGKERTVHVVVKPTQPNLDTNMVIGTDRRTYFLRLVSQNQNYVTRVSFAYTANDQAAWNDPALQPQTQQVDPQQSMAAAMDRLNFGYAIDAKKGSPSFKPLKVFDDGAKTYFQMPERLTVEEAPVVVLLDKDGSEQLVNYRLSGTYYVIDRLFERAALIVGVGRKQERVEISRKKCKRGMFSKTADRCEG